MNSTDPGDYIEMKMEEFRFGGTFYRRESENDFAMCIAPTEDEFKGWSIFHQIEYREAMKKFHKEGRLFLNRNNPWGNFIQVKKL